MILPILHQESDLVAIRGLLCCQIWLQERSAHVITRIKHIHNWRYLCSSGRKKGGTDWRTDLRHNNLAKLFKYRTAGVWEYWIVNPLKNTVQVYLFEGTEDSSQYSFDDDVTVTLYGDLKICIADLLNKKTVPATNRNGLSNTIQCRGTI